MNERAIDSWFERITEGLSDEQKADLKRKFAKKSQVYGADDRIRLIALDIANHFVKNIDEGLKGPAQPATVRPLRSSTKSIWTKLAYFNLPW